MKIQEKQIEHKRVIQIYLTKKEKEDKEIQEKIEQIKAENKSVVLFVSGDKEVEKSLKAMIMIMKNAMA